MRNAILLLTPMRPHKGGGGGSQNKCFIIRVRLDCKSLRYTERSRMLERRFTGCTSLHGSNVRPTERWWNFSRSIADGKRRNELFQCDFAPKAQCCTLKMHHILIMFRNVQRYALIRLTSDNYSLYAEVYNYLSRVSVWSIILRNVQSSSRFML